MKYKDAVKSYDEAIDLDENYTLAWYGKAFALARIGRYEDSIVCYYRVLEVAPDSAEIWYNKGLLLDELGRYQEASDCYSQALQINSNYSVARFRLNKDIEMLSGNSTSISANNKNTNINPQKAITGGFWSYLLSYKYASPDDNTEISGSIKDLSPEFGYDEAWYGKASTYSKLEMYEDALHSYDMALAINPVRTEAWYEKGSALDKLGKSEEALECYQKALDIDPQSSSAW